MLNDWSNFIVLGQLAAVLNPICQGLIAPWNLHILSEMGRGLIDYALVWVVFQVMQRRPGLINPKVGGCLSLWLVMAGSLHLWTIWAQPAAGIDWIAIGTALEALTAGLIIRELLAAFPKILNQPIRDRPEIIHGEMAPEIPEDKRVELTLQESETCFRTLCESMPCVAVQGYDHQRRVIFWNSASEALYGYSQAEALGQTVEDLIIPPSLRDWAIATINAWMQGGDAIPAGEMTVCRKDGSLLQVFASHQQLTDAQGQPAMYCMDIDLSDRQQAKLAQQRLTNILEATADLVAMLDDQGQVSYLNPAGRRLLGLTPEDDLSNLPLSPFLLPVAIPSALEQGTWQGELAFFTPQGDRRAISVALIAHRTPDGQLDYLSLIARDISPQKQVEKDLQENQKFLRLVIDNIPQSLFWKDRDSRFLGGNRQFVKDAGVSSIQEILGKTDYDFAWCEQAPLYQADDRFVMQSNQPKLNIEEPITKSSGIKGWLRTNKIPLHDIQGNVVGVLVTYEDISERKQAELTLQNLVSGTACVTGKDFFPVLVRHLSLALAVRYAVVLERVEDQLISLALYGNGTLQPNLSLSFAEASCCRLSMEQGQYQCFEQVQQVFPELGLFKQLGAESYLGIALKDATGQSIGNLCIIHDRPLKPSAHTEAILQIFAARAAAELERKRALEALRQLNVELEDRIHQRTIELAQINHQLQAEISDRIQAEKALRESEEKFRQLAENIGSVFWMVDLERPKDIYYVSSSYERIWGRPCQTVYQQPRSWFSSIHLEDQLRIAKAGAMEKQIRGEYDEEYRIVRPDGEIRWIRDRAFPITNRQGKVYRLAGIAEDITQRKQAEIEIIRNQDLREAIFNESADAIFLVDPETLLTIDCNRRAVEMFEANCKEDLLGIEGRMLQRDSFGDEELSAINQEIHAQAMWSRELEYRTFQGKIFWGNLAVKRISVAGRTLNLTRVTDISDRQEAEQKIRSSLQEKEVLLKEIHHRVKNNLYIISSLLKLQTRCLTDAKALEIFKDSQNRVHSMALIHEKLYQSKDLANINFAEYVQNLATDVFRSYGTNPRSIQLQIDVSDTLFSVDIAIPCGLIINELLSNSLKYAFNGQDSGYILIQFQQNSQQDYLLMIKDNGIGFPPDLDFQQTPSLGLRLVCNLTEQLEGTITLIRDQGTCFCLTFPRHHRG